VKSSGQRIHQTWKSGGYLKDNVYENNPQTIG
jgi:hypothetical protein